MHLNDSLATEPQPKFSLGKMVTTRNALKSLAHEDIVAALARHIVGDWGDVDEHDKQQNERALVESTRLLSVYHSGGGIKFWVITEWDRSITTVLLPEDY